MKKYFKPDDYVLARVVQYPSLFAAETFEQAKLRVYDQLLNVIGNGIRDNGELSNEMIERPFNRDRATRFCNGGQAVYGYFKFRDFGGDFRIGEGESITVGDWEKDNHPDVVHWTDCGYCHWNPYPNFSKEYSIIWNSKFRNLGPEWVSEAVWYYGKCRDWFETSWQHYHGAYPSGNQAKDAQYVTDMFKQRDRYESDEAFSKAYGLEYNGDMVEFMTRRSRKTIDEAIAFIDKTIKEFS